MQDLSSHVTAFVTTVGAPTFESCIEHLRRQDCRFRLEVIANVAPMSAAFARMLERCRTPYYVQVDEDMLLYPHAVRTLYERISGAPANLALCIFPLYDVHLETAIYGIKIFRHAVVRRYPFRDVEGCEWDQVWRLRRDGYVDERVPLESAARDGGNTLGLHGPCWTPLSIYERYRTVERKRRRFGSGATSPTGRSVSARLPELGPRLLQRFMLQGSELDLFAVLGILSGALGDLRDQGHEKDYRTYDRLPGFEAARRFVDDARERATPHEGTDGGVGGP